MHTFYNRFNDNVDNGQIDSVLENLRTQSLDNNIPILEESVVKQFLTLNSKKAAGPDNVPPYLLKSCARQLAPVFTHLFNLCSSDHIPVIWKTATIIPVPKHGKPTLNNDYRPVALTSVPFKCLERIILERLLSQTGDKLDQYQYAYRKNKSTEDCVLTLVENTICHLERPQTYARALFIDYSSTFNTIKPLILIKKLTDLNVPSSLCAFILDFLTKRQQRVRISDVLSDILICNVGSPQGCVLSVILYVIYTNDLSTLFTDCMVLKYADDTVILGLIHNNSEDHYREQIDHTYKWCCTNNLILNTKKTKEVIFDFRKKHRIILDPIIVDNSIVEVCENFKYLGIVVDNKLSWHDHISYIVSKCNQRLFFLRLLNSFSVTPNILQRFFCSIIESIYKYNMTVWYKSAHEYDRKKIDRIWKSANRIIRNEALVLPSDLYTNVVLKKVSTIMKQPEGLFKYEFMRSGTRLRGISCSTQRYRKSFYPDSVYVYHARH